MEREKRLTLRREQERKRNNEKRKALLMVEYIHIKHPTIYDEANEYYETLDKEYSNRKDLRKVEHFKKMKVNTDNSQVYNDNMVLRIPLIPNNSAAAMEEGETIERRQELPNNSAAGMEEGETIERRQELPNNSAAATEEGEMIEPWQEQIEDVNSIQPTLLEQVPQDVLQKIIDELRLDPFLEKLMDKVEQEITLEGINQTEQDLMLDIDIDIPDNLLENELLHW